MTTPTGYREFTKNNAEEAMRASGITTPEILIAKAEDDGVYEGRWRFVTIFNAQDLASDTFTCIDVVTGAEVSPSFVPLSASNALIQSTVIAIISPLYTHLYILKQVIKKD